LDSAVFIYAIGVDHPYRAPCRALVTAMRSGDLVGEASVLAVQEVMHQRLRTGFQYEGAFRCRASLNSSNCKVTVWLKGRNGLAWGATKHARSYTIPRDDKWSFVLDDAIGGAGGNTDVFDLWINAQGFMLMWTLNGLAATTDHG
jgi:hypothetical protein